MNTRALGFLLLIAVPAAPAIGAAGGVRTDVERVNVVGSAVEIALVNASDEVIWMGDTWTITSVRDGGAIADYCWARSKRRLQPGERRVWNWDQRDDAYGMCAQSHPGSQVSPGPYRVTFDGVDLSRRFQIGQFFTVGFDHLSDDETFTVFVNRADDIAQMTAEAEAEDKTLIVSGIVRRERNYNAPWTFTMGPGSIVLGEVFIEVCDADPYYVQENQRGWMGERWCPWSSYVAAVGR